MSESPIFPVYDSVKDLVRALDLLKKELPQHYTKPYERMHLALKAALETYEYETASERLADPLQEPQVIDQDDSPGGERESHPPGFRGWQSSH